MVESIKEKSKDPNLLNDLVLTHNTASLILNHAKGNMDLNLLEKNLLEP
jgi:hypothetical protein